MENSTDTGTSLSGFAGGRSIARGLWRDLREAIGGTQRDFTEGSVGKAILLLSVPMVLELVMESIFAVVDIFFVSKLGADAVATVGITESMMTIVYAIGIGLSMAATAMVARRAGEKDAEGVSVAAVQAIWVGILLSLPIMALGAFYSPWLLQAMGASQAIVTTGQGYTQVMMVSNAFIMLLFIINAIFRGVGDAAVAMRVLWLANSINIVLDPCLILGLGPFPELGVRGAAIATAIGRGTGVLFQLWHLAASTGRVQISARHLRLKMSVMRRLLRLSMGGIGQLIIATSGWIGLVRIMATFGSAAVAGYTIAVRIVIFSILPSWGMSNAAATLVGQNLGAKKPDRAERSVWVTAWINTAFLVGVGILFLTFSEFLVRIFTQDVAVVAVATRCLRYISCGYPFYAFGMVMTQAFNGAGDTTTPTIMNFICFWLMEIPLAWVLALQMGYAETGVFIAIVAAESLLGVLGVMFFRRGTWQKKMV